MKLHTLITTILTVAIVFCGVSSARSADTATFESTVTFVSEQHFSADLALSVTPQPTPTCWPGDKRCWPDGSKMEVAVTPQPTPTCWPGDKRCWPDGSKMEVAVTPQPTPTCWPGDKRCWPDRHVA